MRPANGYLNFVFSLWLPADELCSTSLRRALVRQTLIRPFTAANLPDLMNVHVFVELGFYIPQIAQNTCIHQVVVELEYETTYQFFLYFRLQLDISDVSIAFNLVYDSILHLIAHRYRGSKLNLLNTPDLVVLVDECLDDFGQVKLPVLFYK